MAGIIGIARTVLSEGPVLRPGRRFLRPGVTKRSLIKANTPCCGPDWVEQTRPQLPLSKSGAELLFEIISQRYERGSLVITSYLPFDAWTEVFGSERPHVSISCEDFSHDSAIGVLDDLSLAFDFDNTRCHNCAGDLSGDTPDTEAADKKYGGDGAYHERKRFQKAVQDTEAFCSRLAELDLIVDSEISFKLPTGESARTKGFGAVDRDRLKELAPDVVDQLFRSGDLELIYAHLASHRSLDDLLNDLPKSRLTLN